MYFLCVMVDSAQSRKKRGLGHRPAGQSVVSGTSRAEEQGPTSGMSLDKADFLKLVRTVSGSAAEVGEEGAGEADRVVDGLKTLRKHDVTLELLSETEAGKKLKKLSKHKHSEIAAAAMEVVHAWKKKLKERSGGKGEGGDEGGEVVGRERREEVRPVVVERSAPGELRKIGEPVRDKVRKEFADALKKDFDKVGGDPNRCAVEIEVAVFKQNSGVTPGYKAKFRSLVFNLKDPKNSSLRRRILQGDLSGDVLVTLPSEELANEEKRTQNEEIKKKLLIDCERGKIAAATTDQFRCGKCKMSKCVYHQMQTRSADEPMTTFVTCTNCNNRWKFC